MNVSLTPYWEQFITELVESGRYKSNSEVVREALRLKFGQPFEEGARFDPNVAHADPAHRQAGNSDA